jgi:hypothetical protein
MHKVRIYFENLSQSYKFFTVFIADSRKNNGSFLSLIIKIDINTECLFYNIL